MAYFRDIEVVDTHVVLPAHKGEAKPESLMSEWIKPLIHSPVGGDNAGLDYLFKEAVTLPDDRESVEFAISEMDKFGIRKAVIPATLPSGPGRDALARYPDRFVGVHTINPNDAMAGVRALEASVRQGAAVAAYVTPAMVNPQVPINDKKMYPVYAKCVDLDIPIFILTGVPGPRVPFFAQHPEHLDEVCWFFPDLKVIMRHGADPWTDLAVKLLLKWPNLYYSTSAFSPKYYSQEIIKFANSRGAEKIIFGGYFGSRLTYDRIFEEMKSVPFADHVWPLFLRDNANRVLKL